MNTLTAGQTVEIDIGSPGAFMPDLQFRVNGAVLASSSAGYLKTWFTAPYGMASLTLQATGQTVYGETVSSSPTQISAAPDSGVAIDGRALDADGSGLPGAALTWHANGLKAEYYRFNRELDQIPDLSGLQPARTGFVSALNYPNPQQVFGADPMGAGLGQNYAVRFSGGLSVATAGEYQFALNAQAGARLRIDGVTITDGSGHTAATMLAAGQHEIEVVYYESGGGSAVQMVWTPPGGVPGVAPPTALTVSAPVTAGPDGRFQLRVPAALGVVQVSIASGPGSVVLGQ